INQVWLTKVTSPPNVFISGFINLDCGLPEDSTYTESTTGVNYISDASYIHTSTSESILPEFREIKQQQAGFDIGSTTRGTFR
ncbi:Malectin-like domain - like 10, partial [Theobroma cacao]